MFPRSTYSNKLVFSEFVLSTIFSKEPSGTLLVLSGYKKPSLSFDHFNGVKSVLEIVAKGTYQFELNIVSDDVLVTVWVIFTSVLVGLVIWDTLLIYGVKDISFCLSFSATFITSSCVGVSETTETICSVRGLVPDVVSSAFTCVVENKDIVITTPQSPYALLFVKQKFCLFFIF